MNLVLQSQAGGCPIAPGADLTVAISLLQMSVLGLPLLLALFQFVNDHEYREPEETVSKRTVLYGLVMMTSALMLWGFYYAAFCMIQSQLDAPQLTNLLFLFMWVMLAIIFVILLIQLEQMVGEGARYSLMAYLSAFGLLATNASHSSAIIRVSAGVLAVTVAYMGWIEQTVGFEQKGEQLAASWAEWKAAHEEGDRVEGMEGMESVYK